MARMLDFGFATHRDICAELDGGLRRQRLAQMLSQRELAARVGLSAGTVKTLEATGAVTLETLMRTAYALAWADDFAPLFEFTIKGIALRPPTGIALLRLPVAISAFPASTGRSARTSPSSSRAQRSLTLRPVCSPSHPVTLYTEGFRHFASFMTAPVASGMSNWPGGIRNRRKCATFHGARRTRVTDAGASETRQNACDRL